MRKKFYNSDSSLLSRRSFLKSSAILAWSPAALGLLSCGGEPSDTSPATGPPSSTFEPSGMGFDQWDRIFRTITAGFIHNALLSSDTFAVCDYPGGTRLNSFVTAAGKTCDSVTRMLPAIAARIVSPDADKTIEVDGKVYELEEVFVSALANATDPGNKDYWLAPPPDKWDQRQVESGIVGWSLWLTADRLMNRFTSRQRVNLQNWLASCSIQQVRRNNWVLFTAVNHAARMALSERWPEFSGDADSFRADLESIEGMYRRDGWYQDSPKGNEYDYYNFWVFASHNLYWDAMVGDKFPELRDRFRPRLKAFLKSAPYFFGSHGGHILFGRSLIYRWATLTPMVLAYRMGLWPYSAGMLRRLCNLNLRFLWDAGAWDEENRKLRETLTPYASRAICESYINSGHPYWCMQAFYAMSFPRDDPFWTAREEPLPVEKEDYRKILAAPGGLLTGCKRSGQVQMLLAACSKHYRNKYYNFSYSSHFPCNMEMVEGLVPPDCSLSFEGAAGLYCRRDTPFTGRVVSDRRVLWQWSATMGQCMIKVESMAWLDDEFQWRAHLVELGGDMSVTAVESTYALGLGLEENPAWREGDLWEYGCSVASGCAVFIRGVHGFRKGRPPAGFRGHDDLNIFYPRGVQAGVAAVLKPGRRSLAAATYASPKPLPLEELLAGTETIPEAIRIFLDGQ